MADRWEVAVQYRLGDLYAVSSQSWRIWLKALAWLLALVMVFELVVPLLSGEQLSDALVSVDYYVFIPMALIVVAVAAISPIFQLRLRKKRGWDVTMLVKLDDGGVSVDHPQGSQRTFWKALPRVRATPERLFLFTTSSSAYILPRRCFASDAQFQRWIEFSEQRWAQAKAAQ